MRQAANSLLRSEPVRAKDLSPGRTALGPGRELTSPGTGRKMRAGPDSYAPFRGYRVLRAVPSAGALGYALASFGLGWQKNRRGLRRKQGTVIRSSAYSLFCLPQTTRNPGRRLPANAKPGPEDCASGPGFLFW